MLCKGPPNRDTTPRKKACCNASFLYDGDLLEEPLCQTCANERVVKTRVTLFWILRNVLGKDVARHVCEHYISNLYEMNAVSRFLNSTGPAPFFFTTCPLVHLERALEMTDKRITSYEDAKWAGTIVVRDANRMATNTFFKEIVPVYQAGKVHFIF